MDDPTGAAVVGVMAMSVPMDSVPSMSPPCSLSSARAALSPNEAAQASAIRETERNAKAFFITYFGAFFTPFNVVKVTALLPKVRFALGDPNGIRTLTMGFVLLRNSR